MVDMLVILSVEFINILVQIIPSNDDFVQCYPTSKVEFLPATLNTACIWSKQSAKKNILYVARVVTFEATPNVLGYGILKKMV